MSRSTVFYPSNGRILQPLDAPRNLPDNAAFQALHSPVDKRFDRSCFRLAA
ncbi:Unknown protein sequence [Pseudomonas syringae pv. cilantro]|uniref:Uncharacterized protein n=1 Tax=Pseudomonas syringae pv. cilantro TaxID=81035 RepID=A0A0N1JMR0_PSESX|nr:Unknown protein sequence [Pseudomonas syringae pv. cilantro]